MNEFSDADLSLVNGVSITRLTFRRKGQVMLTKKHTYPHQALLAEGSLKLRISDRIWCRKGPCVIVIAADEAPFLESLTDYAVLFCIQAVEHCDDLKAPLKELSICQPH